MGSIEKALKKKKERRRGFQWNKSDKQKILGVGWWINGRFVSPKNASLFLYLQCLGLSTFDFLKFFQKDYVDQRNFGIKEYIRTEELPFWHYRNNTDAIFVLESP